MLSAALLLGGCSKEPAEGMDGDRTEITADAFLPGESPADAGTKATVDGSTALTLSFARADETSAGSYGAYGTEFTGTRAAGTGSTVLAFDPVQYYLKKGLKTKIMGWYPGGATEAGSSVGYYDASAGTVGWIIDGQQDILSASAQEGSSTSAMPGFVFNHRLAQIQFWPYAENAEAIALWGSVKSITLLDQPEQYTLTLPQDGGTDAVFSAEGNADFTVRNLPSGNLSTTAAIQGDPVMIAPTTDNTILSLIIGMADGKNLLVTVPERTYHAGSVTAVKLKFTSTGEGYVEPTITISDWVTAGELNNYPKVVNGNTIIRSDDVGEADENTYPIHIPWLVTPSHSESAWNGNASGYNTASDAFEVASADASSSSTWAEAKTACQNYSQASGAKGLWRLPTIRELKVIYDKKDALFATNQPSSNVWSATESGSGAWNVHFGNGGTNGNDKGSALLVRCVRDTGLPPISDAYPKVEGGKTLVIYDDQGMADPFSYPTHEPWTTTPVHHEPAWEDNTSGYNTYGRRIVVAAAKETSLQYYDDAVTYCEGYSEGSYPAGSWRLPTIREMQCLYEHSGELTMIAVPRMFVWSGTRSTTDDRAWAIKNDGSVYEAATFNYYGAWAFCVHDI